MARSQRLALPRLVRIEPASLPERLQGLTLARPARACWVRRLARVLLPEVLLLRVLLAWWCPFSVK